MAQSSEDLIVPINLEIIGYGFVGQAVAEANFLEGFLNADRTVRNGGHYRSNIPKP